MPNLSSLLDTFRVGPGITHAGVTAIPLLARAPAGPPTYTLLPVAMAKRELAVTESGPNHRLRARNRGSSPVFVLEGDHLLGATQNRAIVSSALLGARSSAILPAACVEQRRSQGPSDRFDCAGMVIPTAVRRIVKTSVTTSLLARRREDPLDPHACLADQAGIWQQIADQQRRLGVVSGTTSLAHTYVARAAELTSGISTLRYHEGAAGLALAIDGELVSLDLFDHPETCRHYWPHLVQGALLDSSGRRRRDARVGPIEAAVAQLLARLGVAPWRTVPAIDQGQELRVALDDLAASALLAEGRILHLGAASMVVQLRARSMRFELPAALASRFSLAERIGVGGTKEVYRAVETATGRTVAIARLPAVDPMELLEEVALSRRIAGGYTIDIYESYLDEHDDGYLVMEHFPGQSLAALCPKALPLDVAGPIMLELCRAVVAVHRAHVLHRDLKLENTLMRQADDGVQLKVIDFGVAARASAVSTSAGELPIRGTAPYMAREVLRGMPVDARADTFAFGVCCHRLLTGEFPLPPADDETSFEYLSRLVHLQHHDLSRLPTLPVDLRLLLERMLEVDAAARPYLTDACAVLETLFGHLPLRMPTGADDRVYAAPASRQPDPLAATELSATIDTTVRSRAAARASSWHAPVRLDAPENVLVAPCAIAPLVVLEREGAKTRVRGLRSGGEPAWSLELPGQFTAGLRVDLDGDHLREIYLAGVDRIAAITAHGELVYCRLRTDLPYRDSLESSALYPPPPPPPTLVAIADPAAARLVVDGRMVDPRTGRDLGRLPYAYEGDGRRLADTGDTTGLSYNGYALQGFRGALGTAAAIVHAPGTNWFHVAQLELAGPRVQLGIYGPGGKRTSAALLATGELTTGDRAQIASWHRRPPLTAAHAPLAVIGEGNAAVALVPLVTTSPHLPSGVAAFSVPGGHELWRARVPAAEARALLADVDGDGKPELVLGTGNEALIFEPWSGAASSPLPCRGLPIAFGDPFGEGTACLIAADASSVSVHRIRGCRPFEMAWNGPRGDAWRTGTVTQGGMTLGPI